MSLLKLNKIQQNAYPYIQWLLDGPRGSGRSTLQAIVMIEASQKTRDWVYPREFDIIQNYSKQKHFFDLVCNMLDEDFIYEVNKLSLSFRITGIKEKNGTHTN